MTKITVRSVAARPMMVAMIEAWAVIVFVIIGALIYYADEWWPL